jgi:hypothetical protein
LRGARIAQHIVRLLAGRRSLEEQGNPEDNHPIRRCFPECKLTSPT